MWKLDVNLKLEICIFGKIRGTNLDIICGGLDWFIYYQK